MFLNDRHIQFKEYLRMFNLRNIVSAAERARAEYPDMDWLHLTALIHDMGKGIFLK